MLSLKINYIFIIFKIHYTLYHIYAYETAERYDGRLKTLYFVHYNMTIALCLKL